MVYDCEIYELVLNFKSKIFLEEYFEVAVA